MYLPLQGFISSFRLLDILDILLVAFVLYKLFILIRNTRAVALIKGLLVLGVVTVVSKVLDLHVINWMLQHDGHPRRPACRLPAGIAAGPGTNRPGPFLSFRPGHQHGRTGTAHR